MDPAIRVRFPIVPQKHMESFNFNKIEKKKPDEVFKEIENSILLRNEKEYIDNRLIELNKSGSTENFGIMYSKIINGFIKSEAKIQRSPMVEPFHLDDPEMYSYIFSTIKKFKETDTWKDKELNSMIIPVIQHAISNYFGNNIKNKKNNLLHTIVIFFII